MDQSAFAAPRRRRYFGTTTFQRIQYTGHLWILGCFGPEFDQKEVRVGAYLSWNRNFGYISSKLDRNLCFLTQNYRNMDTNLPKCGKPTAFCAKFRRKLDKLWENLCFLGQNYGNMDTKICRNMANCCRFAPKFRQKLDKCSRNVANFDLLREISTKLWANCV